MLAVLSVQILTGQSKPRSPIKDLKPRAAAAALVTPTISASPEDIVTLRVESERYGPPVGRPVEVRIQSEDFAVNKKIAEEIKTYLATIPGVDGIDDNLKEGPREIRLEIDDERAAQFGLTFEDLARALRGANEL